MTPTETTLADFLLARIAEDEARARDDSDPLSPIPLDCWPPERVLAECEVKRRIVERLGFGPGYPCWVLAQGILADLALPHADHPDYREEWKP